MIKSLIKKIASPARLSGYAADGVQNAVNNSSESVKSKMVNIATTCNELSAIAQNLSAMAMDGKIDDMEREALVRLFEPIFAKVEDLI